MKRSIFAILFLAAGTIFGPLLIAAASAGFANETSDISGPSEASRLVDAYRARLPSGHLFMSVTMPPYEEECGYQNNQVFGKDAFDKMVEARLAGRWTPIEGYDALHRWRGQNRDEDWIVAIIERMDSEMSDFETGFLRRCIQSTLFYKSCMARVDSYGDKVERFDESRTGYSLSGGHEDEVVCTFVDGVAARKGIPLPKR